MPHKQKMLFPGQQENEQIHLIFREHWARVAGKVIGWLIFGLVYIALDYFQPAIVESIDPAYIPVLEVFKISYLMFMALGLFLIFLFYYLNMHIVTNERIVDVEQKSLLHHTISELHLEQIQDVTAEVHGLMENLLDYGDVYIQTAGETQRFKFNKIGNPTKVTKVILDLYEQLPAKNTSLPNTQNRLE